MRAKNYIILAWQINNVAKNIDNDVRYWFCPDTQIMLHQ